MPFADPPPRCEPSSPRPRVPTKSPALPPYGWGFRLEPQQRHFSDRPEEAAEVLLDRVEAVLGAERLHIQEALHRVDSSLARTGMPVQEDNLRGQLQVCLKS